MGQNPLMGQVLFEEAMRRRRRRLRLRLLNKGQETSEENCGVLNSSKETMKLFPNFCPMSLKWVK